MREVVIDTETTGLDPSSGHRLVEVAALELVERRPGAHFHSRINPERDVPEGAFAIHGLSRDDLRDSPVFAQVGDEFLKFIGEDRLIIHNAPFDLGFLNMELKRAGQLELTPERVTDTLVMARAMGFTSASLDALCRHYRIDLSVRSLHGALVDCRLLAKVYLRLSAPPEPEQSRLGLARKVSRTVSRAATDAATGAMERVARIFAPSAGECEEHRQMLAEHIPDHRWPSSLPEEQTTPEDTDENTDRSEST
ncbi:MAG: DNA polymerase III subunit epsilon [Alphaproteobacteria bacterium]